MESAEFCGSADSTIDHTMLPVRLERSVRSPALTYPFKTSTVDIGDSALSTLIFLQLAKKPTK